MIKVKSENGGMINGMVMGTLVLKQTETWSDIMRKLNLDFKNISEINLVAGGGGIMRIAAKVAESIEEIEVNMIDVESSVINAIGYDRDENELYVQFDSNSEFVYRYTGVGQDIFIDFLNANSKGTFYSENIRGKYNPAEKLELVD
jgi:hypothetical protein